MIIATFVQVAEADVATHQPTIVFVDAQNRPRERRAEIPGPRRP